MCCVSAPCSQFLHSGFFFIYVDSDPRSLLISFLIILGVACHVFALCWFLLITFFDPLLLFFWDGPSAKGVWRLPNVRTVNCRWSLPHCACYAISVRVSLLWVHVMIQCHPPLVVGYEVVAYLYLGHDTALVSTSSGQCYIGARPIAVQVFQDIRKICDSSLGMEGRGCLLRPLG